MNKPDTEQEINANPNAWLAIKVLLGVVGIIYGLSNFAIESHEKEEERQQEVDQALEKMREDVRNGKGDKASNFIFKSEHNEYLQSLDQKNEQEME
ncbi:MAG: hypothetical protein ACKVH8_19265 [Pirellulales bacterium]